MDQAKIGKFIAECRKERHLTQAQLAEKLGISDRAVSKWETGRSMPDSSLMMQLCDEIGINVNELLSGRRIEMDNYKDAAEAIILEMRKKEEQSNRYLLRLEVVIGILSTVSFLILSLSGTILDIPVLARAFLIAGGFVIFIIGLVYALKIERNAGYYECGNCHRQYVPEIMDVTMAIHRGRTRRMKCPHCGVKAWHKKVLIRSEQEA